MIAQLRRLYHEKNVETVMFNCIGGVMVSMLASSEVDRVFEPRCDQTKGYTVGICCFTAKHAV